EPSLALRTVEPGEQGDVLSRDRERAKARLARAASVIADHECSRPLRNQDIHRAAKAVGLAAAAETPGGRLENGSALQQLGLGVHGRRKRVQLGRLWGAAEGSLRGDDLDRGGVDAAGMKRNGCPDEEPGEEGAGDKPQAA